MEADVKEWLKENGRLFLEDIGIREGQAILDYGCNVGHYTIPAARVAGKEGKVYALDKDMGPLNELTRMARTEGLRNVVLIHGQTAELKIRLKDESVDVVLLYDVLHYMDAAERKKIYDESHRILKIDGLLSVYPKHYKLDEPLWNLSDVELEYVIKEIESAKFHFERQLYKQLIHDNNYNAGYILNFTKK
jgi:ubiquinone/menaquinone biosynthesis C-methylase UbiE